MEDERIVQKALDFTGLNSYANQYVDTLSGGIRQRAFFAMVLAQDCDYIILDEPTTYLDIAGQREFLSTDNFTFSGKNHHFSFA